MKRKEIVRRTVIALAVILTSAGLSEPQTAWAQGSRKDDIVFGPSGHPFAGATVRVCQPIATGIPCSPLATIYTDATLTVAAPDPFPSDGIGNYHFYAPAGRYQVQISSPQINGTITYPDVILPADLSSSGSGNNISAFGLTLGGNLSVGGNATISGTLTTTNFNPGNFTPSSLTVTGNESVQGPRPRVDVTAFGAKGDGGTDDTAAIQAAINAACQSNASGGGDIFFPPTINSTGNAFYALTQSQGTSAFTPVLTIPSGCAGLHFVGGNSAGAPGNIAFPRSPSTVLQVLGLGPNPSPSPVFGLGLAYGSTVANGAITFENLTIKGHNQAIGVWSQAFIVLKNSSLSVANSGQPDNTPLKLTNTFWFWMEGGELQVGPGSSNPVALFTGETPISADEPLVGLVRFTNVVGSGGGFQYIQRATTCCSGPGNFIFDNVQIENIGNDFFAITNPGSVGLAQFTSLTFNHAAGIDPTGPPGSQALLSMNASGTVLSGVTINHSYSNGPAIRMNAGTLVHYNVNSCQSQCTYAVLDGSGNPVGSGYTQSYQGLDFIRGGTSAAVLRSDLFPPNTVNNGPAIRETLSGNHFASNALDPSQGLLFNTPPAYGFNAYVNQSSTESVDVGFANLLPPTGISLALSAGGTLTVGQSYWYTIRPTGSGCGDQSAPSLIAGPITPTTGNQSVALTWTLPPKAILPPNGYCITRVASASNPGIDAFSGYLFTGNGTGSTTSFTDTGAALSGGNLGSPAPTLTPVHRFTPTSLGLNTLSPQFNLDVNGSAAVNSMNMVQKAERFAGADAAAKLNACLSAASTSSSVCDARGMTGTLTGSAHITIPAGTILLWGSGQLTVTDTTTNDAIELGGDGASIYGYQESGLGTVSAPDTSGYIACATTGCTTVKKPNQATSKINFVHIVGMYLQATGANSKVIDLTSIGHGVVESNNLALGTGGNSYGVFGDTSTGDFDGTNTLIRHNNVGLNSTGDTCFSLAGVYNAVVVEQNVCTLAPAASYGYVFKKDSNGNYPDNDEIYGNDCETSSTAFGQICYNIVGALSITFGPNNRCEKVYNCLQFPTDGSANGIHVLDPYLSLSNTNQVNPNEPATSTVAIDNNGHNWLPSMHYGMNDLSGPNLLGNAGFEGWQNSTALYYWGGVSGTNINQAGSGIYLQGSSSGSSPAADPFTQGSFNVRVGDGATAGLGIHSGCVQVDPLREYTLMFRVASGATSNNFRPGFRFYSDPNCTEADKITSVATNARVLTPANYAGNLQSTNASLTYNNGITCNCNVTGADWQVSTANSWTANRNFGIVFRVPNAYTSNTTVAQSMRVFLLENTAAASNYVYFDDVILSQGPVTPDIRPASLRDSGNPAVYGSLAISQHLNQSSANTFAGTVALSGGTAAVTFPTAFNSPPVCTANDTSAIATVRVQTTATTLTLSQSSGTDTIMYICVGNPN